MSKANSLDKIRVSAEEATQEIILRLNTADKPDTAVVLSLVEAMRLSAILSTAVVGMMFEPCGWGKTTMGMIQTRRATTGELQQDGSEAEEG